MFAAAGHSKKILSSFLCAGYANGQKDSEFHASLVLHVIIKLMFSLPFFLPLSQGCEVSEMATFLKYYFNISAEII